MTAEAPEPQGGAITMEDMQQALAELDAKHTAVLTELQTQHEADLEGLRRTLAGPVASPIPEFSGGPGISIAGTWSLAEQEAERTKAHSK
jgi:hypothetical protein